MHELITLPASKRYVRWKDKLKQHYPNHFELIVQIEQFKLEFSLDDYYYSSYLKTKRHADIINEMQAKKIDTSIYLDETELYLDLDPYKLATLLDNLLRRNASLYVIELLCKMPVAINTDNVQGNTPLATAAYKGNIRAVKLLMQYGADPARTNSKTGRTIIHTLILGEQLNLELIDILCTKESINAKDAEGRTPLFFAVQCHELKAAKKLLARGADASLADKAGKSPLHIAIEEKLDPEFIESLLQSGIGANVSDNSGQTPLHYAIKSNTDAVIRLLLKSGSNPGIADNQGRTALHIAIQAGCSLHLINLLCKIVSAVCAQSGKEPANYLRTYINRQDGQGNTPLHYAAYMFWTEAVNLLLNLGADPLIQNKSWQNAYWMALRHQLCHQNLPAIFKESEKLLRDLEACTIQRLTYGSNAHGDGSQLFNVPQAFVRPHVHQLVVPGISTIEKMPKGLSRQYFYQSTPSAFFSANTEINNTSRQGFSSASLPSKQDEPQTKYRKC